MSEQRYGMATTFLICRLYCDVLRNRESNIIKNKKDILLQTCFHDTFINTPNNQMPFAHTASVYIENEWAKRIPGAFRFLSKY